MTKKFLVLFCLSFLFVLFATDNAAAVENPLSYQNNKFGIHILFPQEINEASGLINSNGGDWGYAVIPIQATDKDLKKWQIFMDDAKKYHVIPIIRIATEGDYFKKDSWRKPRFEDVLDFANFLDSLKWPTKNRYVVIFNEPNNRGEWGGDVNPSEYAKILTYAVSVFKSKSQDFFMISAGLDNAASNRNGISMNEYDYMRQMNAEIPGIFNQIDGFSSHSYPNPAFSQPPSTQTQMSITSFRYEKNLVSELGGKEDLPVFITETGWSSKTLSEDLISSYLKEAFMSVWNDENIVAITPFILKATAGPFVEFSFIRNDQTRSKVFDSIENMPKTKGQPSITADVLGENIQQKMPPSVIRNFSDTKDGIVENKIIISNTLKTVIKWLLKI
ncbi:MAG: glycosyl hydrolase [bacterium]|nr:glycosyl hydrolase [bacterium]